ncbi:MAG: hypothetical protein ACOYEV_08585 [Candidatus Nanopelagicales bacterium]
MIAMIVGGLMCLAALVKLMVIGFYPEELMPWLAVLLIGAAGVWAGEKFGKASTQA